MKASERLRKQMQEKGLIGTDAKKAQTIVSTKTKEAEKPASFLQKLAGGTSPRVETVKDTGAGDALRTIQEKRKKNKTIRQEMKVIGKGIRESGATDFETFRKAAEKQVELQKQLPTASFTAGLLDSMGGDVAKISAKLSGNDAYKKQVNDTMTLLQQTKESNPAWGTAGALTGELAKAGAGYATIGGAAEKAVLKNAAKLGLTGTKARAMAALLAQQTADTAVNTPITMLAGAAEGKTKAEISKDIGKQFATDAVFNAGLGALGTGFKYRQATKQTPDVLAAKGGEKTDFSAFLSKTGTQTAKKPEAHEVIQKNMRTAEKAVEMLKEEDLPELAKRYQLFSDERYLNSQMEQLGQKFGKGTAVYDEEVNKLYKEKEDLEDALGIRTKKVKDAERRIYNEAVRNIKKTLSIFGQADTAEANRVLQRAVNEAKGGYISQNTREDVFENLFALGKESNRMNVDEGLKNDLKKMNLKISETDAANIADFESFRKSNMGKIGNISKAEKGNVDTTWLELHDKYPQWFSEDIINPADQLQRIAEVANEMRYHNIPISETMAAEEKMLLREGFDEYMNRIETEMQKLRRYTDERAQKQVQKLLYRGELPDYSRVSAENVKALYDEKRKLQREAERVRRKVNLTEGDKLVLQKLLRNEIREAEARQLTGVNAEDLMKLYEVEKPLNRVTHSIQEYKRYANGKAYDDAANIVGEMDMRKSGKEGWHDPAPFRMARETQERILDMVAPNKEKAKELNDHLFAPVHENERLRTLFKNEYIDRIKDADISTKNNITVKKADGSTAKTSESALVQYLGESRYQLQKMEQKKKSASAEEIQAELQLRAEVQAIENSLTKEQRERVDNGIMLMRQIYEEIHPKINEVLIRNGFDPIGYIEGYFPHMSFDDPDNIMEAAAKKLGFDFASKELPMDIAGRTEGFRPGKKWAGNLLTRTGTKTDYDALRAFDAYIENISDVIYHTDDIKKLRAYEDYIRYTLSDEGIRANVDKIRERTDLDEFEKAEKIEKEYGKNQEHTLQNYVNNIRLYTDLLAGKKHNIDRILETHLFGRKVYKVVNEIENRVASNMVGANIGSALTNVIPVTQGMSSMSTGSNLKGLKEALVRMSQSEMDELTKRSAFLATRKGNDALYKTFFQKAGDKAFWLMEKMDTFSTQAVWRSRYYDNLKKGVAEDAAIKEADSFCRGLFAGRSKGAMPTIFSSKTVKPLTMFQLEVNNQISYLMKDIPKNAQNDAGKIMKAWAGIVIGAYIYNDVYEKLTGRRAALDPFGIANEAVGDLTGERVRNLVDIAVDAADGGNVRLTEEAEEKKPSQALATLTETLGSNVPFVGGALFDGGRIPVQSAMPSGTAILGAIGDMASGDASEERGKQTLRKELAKPVKYLAMPTGGGQFWKTVQGLKTMKEGGSYSQTNDGPTLQYPVDQDKKRRWVQSALFGKWATPEAQEYLEKANGLGAKQTETYEALVAAGAKNIHAFDVINRIRAEEKADKKRSLIRGSLMNGEQKAILYRDLVAGEDSKDTEILKTFEGTDVIGDVVDCLIWMAEHDSTVAKRSSIVNSELNDWAKEYIYLQKVVQKNNREKEQSRIDMLKNAGMKIDDFLKIRNKFSQIDDSVENSQKYATMKSWMKEQGYSFQQWQAADEAIGFWITFRLNQKKAEKTRW